VFAKLFARFRSKPKTEDQFQDKFQELQRLHSYRAYVQERIDIATLLKEYAVRRAGVTARSDWFLSDFFPTRTEAVVAALENPLDKDNFLNVSR
jgi:hypothetical protein